MKKVLLAVVVLAVLGGGGFAAWWKSTEFERTVDECKYGASNQTWPILEQQPDDPRVVKIAEAQLHFLALADQDHHDGWAMQQLMPHAAAVLEKHASATDERLVDVAGLMTVDGDARAMKWVKRPPEDLFEAMASREYSHLYAPDNRIKILEQLRPKTNGALVYLLLLDSAGGPGTLASKHLAAGVPPDGQPFVPLDEKVERLAPAADPRYTRAVVRRLHHFADTWSFENNLESLNRVLSISVVPPLDVPMVKALDRAVDVPRVTELAVKLVRPGDAALVRANASPKAQAVLLGALADPGTLSAVLDEVRSVYAGYFQWGDDDARKNLNARTDQRAKQIAAMGPKVVPALRAALTDEDIGVRRLAARALEALDRKQWAKDTASALRAGRLGAVDAALVVEMAKAEPVELEPLYGCYAIGHDDITREVTAFVTKKVGPEVWVAALFDNLAVGEQFPISAVTAYQALLNDTAGTAPHVAKALQKQLDAAGGAPGAVYWLAKRLGLEALRVQGTQAERPLVEKFAGDLTGFDFVTSHWDEGAKKTVEDKRERTFIGQLARDALAAIDGRK